MLSPKNRMRSSAEFGSVMRGGRRSSQSALGVAYLPPRSGTAETEPPRIGFVVSKAVGGAVVRKRVQRRLRHLMRSRSTVLPNGSLLVVRARPEAATARYEELAAQLDSAIAAAMRPRGTSSRPRRGRRRPPAKTSASGETAGERRPDEGGERWKGR